MTKDSVIDNFLVWQFCKKKCIQSKIIDGSLGKKELRSIVAEVRKEYREKNYSYEEKIEKLKKLDNNPEYRLKVFEECSWRQERVNIRDLGTTLPRFGDIPPEVITKTLPEVVRFVENADPEKYKNVKYIKSLQKYPEILKKFQPWVITPANRPSKKERMNRVHGEKDWNIEDTWGMINDGNHRAIAKILANDSEELECFVGKRSGQ